MQPSRETHESIALATRSASAPAEALAIAIGGALGASLSFAVALGMQAADQHGAWATVVVNLIGAFVLGVIVAGVGSPTAQPLLPAFLVVGVFGSFTTFSALAFDNRLLAAHNGEASPCSTSLDQSRSESSLTPAELRSPEVADE